MNKDVLIVGGGFGGVKAALELAGEPSLKITLLSDQETFRYYPSLYHTATGGTAAQSNIPLKTIFAGKPVTLATGEAKAINKDTHTLETSGGQKYHYDFLILALGVVTNYFGIKGLEEYSYDVKSLEEAEKLKHHLHQQLLDKHEPDLNYIIIGGGPTGIELAGALPEYLEHIMKNHALQPRKIHIDLVEAAPRLMPRMSDKMSEAIATQLEKIGVTLYLGQKVEGETADALMVSGKPITSHTVIWTAGVTNHPFFKDNEFELIDKGKVVVDPYLQAAPDIFILGDNANTPFSGMAQTALYDAKFVSRNLRRHMAGKPPQAYRPKKPIYVTPAGPHWAAVLWGKVELYGYVGWLLRELADFVAFHDLEPLRKASKQWLTEFTEQEECPECAKASSR